MVKGTMTFKPNKGGMITVQIDVKASPEAIMELAPNYGKEMSPVPVEVNETTVDDCPKCAERDALIQRYNTLFLDKNNGMMPNEDAEERIEDEEQRKLIAIEQAYEGSYETIKTHDSINKGLIRP